MKWLSYRLLLAALALAVLAPMPALCAARKKKNHHHRAGMAHRHPSEKAKAEAPAEEPAS